MKKILLFVAILAFAGCSNDDEKATPTLTDLNGTWKEVSRYSNGHTYKVDCNYGNPELFVFYENSTYRTYDACTYNPENELDYIEEGGSDMVYNFLWIIDGHKGRDYHVTWAGKNKIKFELWHDLQRGDVQGEYSIFERVEE